jgi:hypothetical protein
MNTPDIIINFPAMHPDLALPGLRLLHPGLDPAPDARRAVPLGVLPLDPRQARQWLDGALAFGEQFKHPGELYSLSLAAPGGYPVDTAGSIQAQLLAMEQPAVAVGAGVPLRAARAKAQAALLLAWSAEERAREITGLDQGLSRSWDQFAQSLGLDADDAEARSLGEPDSDLGLHGSAYLDFGLPWRTALEAFWTLAPEGAALCCADPAAAGDWLDAGPEFTALSPGETARLFPGLEQALGPDPEVLAAECDAFALLGGRRDDPARPWLAARRRVFLARRRVAEAGR